MESLDKNEGRKIERMGHKKNGARLQGELCRFNGSIY